jgi:hypothetical protein
MNLACPFRLDCLRHLEAPGAEGSRLTSRARQERYRERLSAKERTPGRQVYKYFQGNLSEEEGRTWEGWEERLNRRQLEGE